jgi:hypothetical protein
MTINGLMSTIVIILCYGAEKLETLISANCRINHILLYNSCIYYRN